jgi:uncharacterized membrane protein YadS
MAKTLLILAAISAALFLILAVLSWRKHKNARKQVSENCTKQNPAYIWGFVFALIFYYGFPIWWWRYGFQNACKLVFSCIAIAAAIQGVLRYLDVIEVRELGESLAWGLFLSIPVRAIAGIWVANNDRRWRQAIVLKRKSEQGIVAEH